MSDEALVSASLERTACYGTCPVYRRAAFRDAGFWGMRNPYTAYEVTDQPSATISYATATRVKRIEHYYGDSQAPAALRRLESEFDRIVHVEQWIGTR